MCGIVGWVGRSREEHRIRARLERGIEAMVHRGPDDQGLAIHGAAGVGMSRLSIVDIEGGQQPIRSEDGNLVIVGNGEIYNAPTLRRGLEERGHVFSSGSDIEVVLHLFEEGGSGAFDALNGMFALAILHVESGWVFVARDRLGIKPLFWASTSQGTIVASEIHALRAALEPGDALDLDVDPASLQEYLRFGYVPAPGTIHRGIQRVRPGHCGWVLATGADLRPWWGLPPLTTEPATLDGVTRQQQHAFVDEAEAILEDAVACRTLGDVPPGAFLSGGLDSGTLVSMLSARSERPVPVFTIAYDDASLDELADARTVAARYGCVHHVDVLTSVGSDEITGLLGAFGEPFGDVSLLPTHRVARLAARHVKFVISGDGGDELFLGYSWLQREARYRQLPRPVLQTARFLAPILGPGQGSRRASLLGKALRAAGDIARGPTVSFLRRRSLAAPELAAELLHPRFRELGPLSPRLTAMERAAFGHTGPPLAGLADLDRQFYLSGDILEKVDRATMLHSLEARVPFLDHRLVELAARIPVAAHLGKRGRGKAILRPIAARHLPPAHLQRRKRGFGAPVDSWFRGDLSDMVRDHLQDLVFRERELLDPVAVDRVLEDHQRGTSNHGHLLWGLLSLAVWSSSQNQNPNSQNPDFQNPDFHRHPGTPTRAESPMASLA